MFVVYILSLFSVFDAKIMLFDHDNISKSKDLNLVDLSIVAKMGRIKFVYLHKFVTDILTFIGKIKKYALKFL